MSQFVDRITVMYVGEMMELGSVKDIFTDALHPYIQALISSLPILANKGQFHGLSGITPSLLKLPSGCVFHTRCAKVMDVYSQKAPVFQQYGEGRWASCYLYDNGALMHGAKQRA